MYGLGAGASNTQMTMRRDKDRMSLRHIADRNVAPPIFHPVQLLLQSANLIGAFMKAIRVLINSAVRISQARGSLGSEAGRGQVVVQDPPRSGIKSCRDLRPRGQIWPQAFPYTPGYGCAGDHRAVARNVTASKPGMPRLHLWRLSGAYAELALCSEDQVHPLPDGISFEQGAAWACRYCDGVLRIIPPAQSL